MNAWTRAERRAAAVVAPHWPGGPLRADPPSWDVVAVRDILTIVLYCLDRDSDVPAGWGRVLWHCDSPTRVRQLVAAHLPAAGHDPAADSGDPAVAAWRWLTRPWDSPSSARWQGLARGIARERTDPAVDLCTGWAADVVAAELSAANGGYSRYDRVRLVGHPGLDPAWHGYVRGWAWEPDDTARTVGDGPPDRYEVSLDPHAGDEHPTVVVPSGHLAPGTDGLRWPQRRQVHPPTTRKDSDHGQE